MRFTDFDVEKAQTIAKSYSLATGIPCTTVFLDQDDRTHECAYCAAVRSKVGLAHDCERSHSHAIAEARRFGGQYIYMCKLGLVHIVTPILHYGQTIGAFLGGPILIIDKDDYYSEEIDAKFSISQEDKQLLYREIEKVAYVDRARVPHMAELMWYLSDYVSSGAGFADSKEQTEQQAQISSYIHTLKQEEETGSYSFETEQEFLSAVEEGDEENAKRLLNEILGTVLLYSGNNLEDVKERVMDLIVLLSRVPVKNGSDGENILAMLHEYRSTIFAFRHMEELVQWLAKVIQTLTAQMLQLEGKFHKTALKRAVSYMRKNSMKKITLEEVAEYVHFTPTYFSKFFKTEMNQNFSDYLNYIRVEQAKKLLVNEDMKIIDVSCCVGFTDQSYFNKVFKRYTGVTPKKYREFRG